MEIDSHQRHDEEGGGENEWDRQGHDQSGSPAQRQQRDDEHDADGLSQGFQEFMD